MSFDLSRRLAAEALGTFFLVMAVVGSGIMAEKLAGGNEAIALLCLFVIITIFVSVSGAHFNDRAAGSAFAPPLCCLRSLSPVQ
jgi:glycerol uptake facilitator-like aquaporin